MLFGRTPVRISFSGGGTDLESYYAKYGGAVLCVTINKYFYAHLSPRQDNKINIISDDFKIEQLVEQLDDIDDNLKLPREIFRYFGLKKGINLYMVSDIPVGTGLGLSGAVGVSLAKLAGNFMGNDLTRQEIAEIASKVEIDILGRPIGKQDQYSTSFGGLNFITFSSKGTKVEPVMLDVKIMKHLEKNLMLFYTGISCDSAVVLKKQKESCIHKDRHVIDNLNYIKDIAFLMRDSLVKGELQEFGKLLDKTWKYKKKVSSCISSHYLDEIYNMAIKKGALGGKILGAGGRGYFLFYCEEPKQSYVRESLISLGMKELKFNFDFEGSTLMHKEENILTPRSYLVGLNSLVKGLPEKEIEEVISIMFRAYQTGKQIFIMGNGGSAATASHFSCDLAKTISSKKVKGFKVIPLTDNVSLMTAWGNDTGFENIFYGQLYNLLNPGDIVIGISGGGNSPSILKAIDYARREGAITIGFTGKTQGDNAMEKLVHKSIMIPSDNYQYVEDIHMILTHLMTSVLKNLIYKGEERKAFNENIDHSNSIQSRLRLSGFNV